MLLKTLFYFTVKCFLIVDLALFWEYTNNGKDSEESSFNFSTEF